MVIKRLLSILTGKKDSGTSEIPRSSSSSSSGKSIDDIMSFVDFVVKSLVDNPGEAKVYMNDSDKGKVINIDCKKEDIGKIIGKNGKTIMAIRLLVSSAASRLNQQLNVEIIEKPAN